MSKIPGIGKTTIPPTPKLKPMRHPRIPLFFNPFTG